MLTSLLAEFRNHIQHVMQRNPVFERALGSTLYRRTVRHRVGERHAQFDHVRTGFHQRMQQRNGQFRIGITRRDERDQRLALALPELVESRIECGS